MKSQNARPLSKGKIVEAFALFILILLFVSLIIQLTVGRSTPVERCNSLGSPAKYQCLSSLAVSESNQSICALLPAPFNSSCYYAIAKNTSAFSLCSKIENSTLRSSCFYNSAVNASNTSLCSYAGMEKGNCIIAIAKSKLNASICQLSNSSKNLCYSIVFTKLAFLKKNYLYCENVSDSINYSLLSSVILNSSIGNVSTIAVDLLERAALSQMPNLPSSIPLYSLQYSPRDFCITGVSYLTQNTSLCSLLNNTASALCYSLLSQSLPSSFNATSALSACERSSYPELCMEGVLITQAMLSKNVSYCSQLTGSGQYECYLGVATATKNASICRLISNQSAASACEMAFSYNTT